jgi:O-glycosyl hydrolase
MPARSFPPMSLRFLSLCLAAVSVQAATVELEVDPARSGQTIRGFGASGCWWAQAAGAWEEPARQGLLRLLFDPEAGIGLDIYRHNLGAGSFADETMPLPLRRTEAMWDAEGRIDPARDVHARRMLREAVAAGAGEVVLFAVSPPLALTRNGRGYGNRNEGGPVSNLAPERVVDFARYLGEAVEFFLHEENLPVKVLSPLNEPEWDWSKPSQEGSFYTPDEAAAVLKACLGELARRGLPVRVEGPEGGSWETAIPYFEAIHRDPDLHARLDDFAVHSYYSNPDQKRKLRAWLDQFRPDARLHMTEWCELRHGLDPGMDSALTLARTVITDFMIGRVSSWQFWLAASPHDYRDALVHLDLEKQTFVPTKRLWALGQFSRHLPPGSVVLPVRSSDRRTPALAARRPDGSVAVVCINPSDGDKTLVCRLAGDRTWQLRQFVVTDERRDLVSLPAKATRVVLPARSVATLIFEKPAAGR